MKEKTPDSKAPFVDRVAVVTGGSQGLGLAVARAFAARGARGIVFCGRDRAKGEAAIAVIESAAREAGFAAQALFVAADLLDVAQCRAVVAAADRAFGRVDALVNCAAATDRGDILHTSPELFDTMFAVNARAPFFLIQDAVKIMRREKIEGAVVNILSVASHGGQPFLCAYCGSKAALATLTKNIAFALLPDRIRVNGLNIGWMNTPGEDKIQRACHGATDGWRETAARGLPFGRLIEPDEVARAVLFLCSAESGLMTGSLVDFDQSVLGAYDAPPIPAARLGDAA